MNDDRLDDPLLHQYRREPDPRFARSLRERLRRAERRQGISRPVMRALATACAIGVVVALFAIPSVRVSAQALLDLFRVRRFAAVQFDEARFEALRSADQDQGLLVFDRKDRLQARWVRRICHRSIETPRHWLPSAQGFVDAARAGMGWGMLPASMAADALRTGALVELVPGSTLQVPLYWQQARAAPQLLERLKAAVRTAAGSGAHALR